MQVNATAMGAYSDWMGNNANNIANVNTDGFNSTRTTIESQSGASVKAVSLLTQSSTDLSQEITEQIPIEGGFSAQAEAIKTQEEMIGTLLDMSV